VLVRLGVGLARWRATGLEQVRSGGRRRSPPHGPRARERAEARGWGAPAGAASHGPRGRCV